MPSMSEPETNDVELDEIVSGFFLATSQSPSSLNYPHRLGCCASSRPGNIVLVPAGSMSEFYIEPPLSYFGDSDTMIWMMNILIEQTDKHLRSRRPKIRDHSGYYSQLPCKNYIRCTMQKCDFPGYAILQTTTYCDMLPLAKLRVDGVQFLHHNVLFFPRPLIPFVPRFVTLIGVEQVADVIGHTPQLSAFVTGRNGPAVVYDSKLQLRIARNFYNQGAIFGSMEYVYCIRCPEWPQQAAEWPVRRRFHGVPDVVTVNAVVSLGCDAVPVAHRQCRQDAWKSLHQWRLSFSRAETLLLNTWTSTQQLVYHMLRFLCKATVLCGQNNFTVDNQHYLLSKYQLKTLMMWMCEGRSVEWWTPTRLVNVCRKILHEFTVRVNSRNCPNYWIPDCNLLEEDVHVNSRQLGLLVDEMKALEISNLSAWFATNYIEICAKHNSVVGLEFNVNDLSLMRNAVTSLTAWFHSRTAHRRFLRLQMYAENIRREIAGETSCPETFLACREEVQSFDEHFVNYYTAMVYLRAADATRLNNGNAMFPSTLLIVITFCCGLHASEMLHGSLESTPQSQRTVPISEVRQLEIMLRCQQKVLTFRSHANDSLRIALLQLVLFQQTFEDLSVPANCLTRWMTSVTSLVYLAVLHYTCGEYGEASQCCRTVGDIFQFPFTNFDDCLPTLQSKLLTSFDDNVDTTVGLLALWGHVTRTANQNQESFFTMETFSHYIRIQSLQAAEDGNRDELMNSWLGYTASVMMQNRHSPLTRSDLLLYNLCRQTSLPQFPAHKRCGCSQVADDTAAGQLVNNSDAQYYTQKFCRELLSAATDLLTTFLSEVGDDLCLSVTTFQCLSLYKSGQYEQCLSLCDDTLQQWQSAITGQQPYSFPTDPPITALLDDDLVCLNGLAKLLQPNLRYFSNYDPANIYITQSTLSLYLAVQCLLKLSREVSSVLLSRLCQLETLFAQTPPEQTLDRLVLRFIYRKTSLYKARKNKV